MNGSILLLTWFPYDFVGDPAFIKQSEEFAITKFKEWIIEQIT
jgi:hypothetical protein